MEIFRYSLGTENNVTATVIYSRETPSPWFIIMGEQRAKQKACLFFFASSRFFLFFFSTGLYMALTPILYKILGEKIGKNS